VSADGREPWGVDVLVAGPEDSRASRSPWVWRIAGGLAVTLVAVLAGPHLLSSHSPPLQHPTAVRRPGDHAGPPAGSSERLAASLVRWAPRGPGVGSAFAVAAVARMRATHPGVDRLLWAGTLDGRDRVAVVSYRRALDPSVTDATEVAALRVDRLADVATARSVTVGYVDAVGGVVGLAWQGDDKSTRLLVLADPGQAQVFVSSAVDYHPNGGISRSWHETALRDGALVQDLGRHVDPVILVRPQKSGSRITQAVVKVQGRQAVPGIDEVRIAGLSSPTYAGPDPGLLVDLLAQSMSTVLELRDADSKVLWSGETTGGFRDSGERLTGRAALVLVRRHDGPTFQAFIYSDPARAFSSFDANAVRWSVADRLPYAFSTFAPEAPLLLVNPGGPGSATIRPKVGWTLHVRIHRNGVALLDHDAAMDRPVAGARVVVRDPSGRTVLRSRMANSAIVDPSGFNL
jgi:hypothetical protein